MRKSQKNMYVQQLLIERLLAPQPCKTWGRKAKKWEENRLEIGGEGGSYHFSTPGVKVGPGSTVFTVTVVPFVNCAIPMDKSDHNHNKSDRERWKSAQLLSFHNESSQEGRSTRFHLIRKQFVHDHSFQSFLWDNDVINELHSSRSSVTQCELRIKCNERIIWANLKEI